MKMFIETERLILREILPTDIDGLFELDSDPEVHRYLGNKPVTTKDQIVEVINFIRQQYVDHGIGRWAIIDKKTNDFIGWTGLKFVTDLTNGHKNFYDLGYRLIRRYWGQGIATETAVASLDYAFSKLHAEEVYAMADCENDGSNKILKKVGLVLIEQFNLEGVPHNWYKIDKKEYKPVEQFETRNSQNASSINIRSLKSLTKISKFEIKIIKMKKLQFKKEIDAPAQKVYETMLGLKDKSTYEHWTSAFNPTSSYEGSWEKGSKILFVGVDENGKKGGMVSEIEQHEAGKFVSIRHYGFLDGNTEITTGEQVEKWAGGHENYSYQENNSITTVTVDMDTIEEYADYFKNTYPTALDKLKEISER